MLCSSAHMQKGTDNCTGEPRSPGAHLCIWRPFEISVGSLTHSLIFAVRWRHCLRMLASKPAMCKLFYMKGMLQPFSHLSHFLP